MSERPILFSTEMVKAILEGRKTQTRRVCKGARELSCAKDWPIETCPYGQPGDRLYIKESYAFERRFDSKSPSELGNAGTVALWYKTNDQQEDRPGQIRGRWRSGRFMPRLASRITLEITKVRVERVQEITLEDCIAEGCSQDSFTPDQYKYPWHNMTNKIAMNNYSSLWNTLNVERGYGWDKNPWVWCIEFKKLEVKP